MELMGLIRLIRLIRLMSPIRGRDERGYKRS